MRVFRFDLVAGEDIQKKKLTGHTFLSYSAKEGKIRGYHHSQVVEHDAKPGEHWALKVGKEGMVLEQWVIPHDPIEQSLWRRDFMSRMRVHELPEFHQQVQRAMRSKIPVVHFSEENQAGGYSIALGLKKNPFEDSFYPFAWMLRGEISKEALDEIYAKMQEIVDGYFQGQLEADVQEGIDKLKKEGIGGRAEPKSRRK